MRLFKRNNKNVDKTIQLTLILLLMMLAAAWLFRVFSVLEVWQQVFAAVLSVTITAVVTKVLLKGQTKAEEIKEREGTIFEEKQKIFKSFLSKMENIVMDEKIERHEIKELIFQISSLSMHTSDERINDILLRLTDCVKCLPYGQDEEMSHIQTKRFAKNVLRLTRALKAELYMSDALDRDNDKLSYRAFGDLINEAQSRDGEELGYPLTFDIMLLFWYSIVEQLKRWGMKFTRRDRDFDQWSTYEDIYADIEYYFSHNKFQREACNFGFNILLPTIPNLNVVYRIELSNNNIAMGFSWVHPHQGPLNEFEIQFLEAMSNCPGGSGSMATNQEWAAYEPMAPLRNLNFQRDMLGFDGDKPIDTSSNIYDFVNFYRRKQFITEFLSIIFMQIGTYIRFIDQHKPAKNKRWINWFKSPGTKEEQLSAQNYYNVVKARALLQTALEIKAAKDIIEKDKDKYEKNPTDDNKEDYDFTVACTQEYISKFGFSSLEEAQEAVEPILDECQQLFKSQCQENDGESLYLYFSFLFHNPTYEDEPTMYGLLRRSAIMGFRYAQLDLGIYEKDVDNTMESLKWLQLASSQDMPEALSVLGDYYNDANSDNYDDTLALIYYRKAAKIYDPVALYNIGYYCQLPIV